METETLEKIGDLFRLAKRAEICFDFDIELRFDACGMGCEIVIIYPDGEIVYEESMDLDVAKQYLIDMFSM